MPLLIVLWQASGESKKTSIRTKTALEQLVAEGRFRGGIVPYGYKLEPSGILNKRKHEVMKLVIEENEADAIRLMFRLCVNSGYGRCRIASALNDSGLKNRDGQNWHEATVGHILHNILYTGVLRSGSSRSDVIPELQIVAPNTFCQAQILMRERTNAHDAARTLPRNTRGQAMLSGNIRCGHCGGRLILTSSTADYVKADLDDMIVSMRDAGLLPNSINSYMRVLKSFFSWCNEQGLTRLNIPLYKAEETVKETYSDAELTALLKKPDIRKTTFAEYRDWVIINFLLNCGSRAATVRAIQIRDVDLDGGVVFYRHTKNRKAQVIPLCSPMIAILREYGRYRGGEPTDYLFCTETGTQLTENGLRQSIARYNTRRGVQKTSIHLFRHTFARKYLIDCGGDAFTLQKLLGHSALAMTKYYCAIYDADLTKNYDNFSPLAQMKADGAKIKMPAKGR